MIQNKDFYILYSSIVKERNQVYCILTYILDPQEIIHAF